MGIFKGEAWRREKTGNGTLQKKWAEGVDKTLHKTRLGHVATEGNQKVQVAVIGSTWIQENDF